MECYTLLNLAPSLTQLAQDMGYEVKWIENTNFKFYKDSKYFSFYITPAQKSNVYSVKITLQDKASHSSFIWKKDNVFIDHKDAYRGFVMCTTTTFLELGEEVKHIEGWYPTYRDTDPQ